MLNGCESSHFDRNQNKLRYWLLHRTFHLQDMGCHCTHRLNSRFVGNLCITGKQFSIKLEWLQFHKEHLNERCFGNRYS